MPATTALLEREGELATIEELLGSAREGSGGLLTIEGEAGAGKTSLLAAASDLAADKGMLLLRARGGEYERDFPYGVVRQLFEPILAEPARRAELLTGTASLAAPVFEPETAPKEGGDPFAVQHGLYWLAADLAATAALVLLVDDAQWADLDSLRALAYLARRREGLSAALALAVRTGEAGERVELLDALRREPDSRLIVPPPLSAAATAALVAAELGHPPSEHFTEACRGATAGNPFLLIEMLRALGSEGVEPSDENTERLARLAGAGVSRSILARLGQLGGESVAVAGAVAVLEPNAEVRPIAALAGLSVETTAAACGQLVDARLLSDSRPLGFVHPLVRAAVLSDISEPERAVAHARAARMLSEAGADSDTVAAHLLFAEPAEDPWVATELRRAAAAALARGAADAAVRYLRRALREPPSKAERLMTSRELGAALSRADDPECIEVLRTVRAALSDAAARAEIATELVLSFAVRRRTDEAVALLEESLAEISDRRSDLGVLLRGHMLLMTLWGYEQVPEGALPEPDEELDMGTLGGRLLAEMTAGLYAVGLGSIEGAGEMAELTAPDPATVEADALAGLVPLVSIQILTLTDRGAVSEDLLEAMIEGSKRRGMPAGIAGSYGARAQCRLLDGELHDAQADADTALRLLRQLGFAGTLSLWVATAVRTSLARGDFSRAEELQDAGGREPISGFPGALTLCARGELRLATGRHAEARHDFLAAAERIGWLPYANPELLGWRTGLACCEAALGNREEALRYAADAVDVARKAGGRRGIGVALRVQGSVLGGTAGIAILREAVEVLAGTRARLQHAQALADLGAALRRANRRKEAREPLREALDIARRCGAMPLAEWTRTELAATGARPRKETFRGVESLTPSELRVARMAAEEMTNREIAQALTVTAKTVETHLRHVFQKLDVGRRTELPAALDLEGAKPRI
jgi:DNA-binding CsgD family transcriptional regulator/tetratricopeptide (TPR) repeat protein